MLVPGGLYLDFKNENLFRPTSSKSRPRLPNRHGNEKEAIERTDSVPPDSDYPQQLAPSISEGTQIGVGYDSQSQKIFPSLLSFSPRASIILPSEQLSRPGRTSIADLETSPLSSICKIGRMVWSKRYSHPHSPRAMSGAEAFGNPLARSSLSPPFDNLVTQSPVLIPTPHETSSGSLIEPRRTEVTNVLPSHQEPPAEDTCGEGVPPSSPTTCINLNTDASTSSPPFISAVPFTNETAYPSINSQFTTPITAARTRPTEFIDEAVLIPPLIPLAVVPNRPRSFNVKKKPPPSQSNSAKYSPTSIIAGQTSSGTCGGLGSPQGIASSSLMCKGVSKSSVPASSMDRKVEPFRGGESYPLSSASKPMSVASTSSDSSYLTMVGPTPQSSCPDLPSPPSTRTPRLSMKRLLPKFVSSSPPKSRSLVNSSLAPGGSSIDAKARPPNLAPSTAADKFESGRTLGDQIRPSDYPGSHPVYPQHSSSSILSVITKVMHSNDIALSKGHNHSSNVQSPTAQPDVSTNSPNSVYETGGSAKPFGRNRKNSTMGCSRKTKKEEMVDIPTTRRRKNVLRKRSNPSMIGLSRSTSTLGSSRSPSDHDNGYPLFGATHTAEQEEPVRRNRRLHDIDRISINQAQAVAVPDRSELEILHSRVGLFNGIPDMKNVVLDGPRKKRRGGVSDVERPTPAALIAMECKTKMSEVPGNPNESCVISDEGKPGESTCGGGGVSSKDRSLVRSASMSDILFNPGSVYSQVYNAETIYYEQDKHRDRARQSLTLSIAMHPNELDEEKLRKNTDVVSSSKAGGGRLRKLMRKFSLSRSGGKRNEHTSTALPTELPVGGDQSPSRFKAEIRSRTRMGPSRMSISSPEISSARPTAPKSSPAYEIPPLPKRPISVPLDLHIVNPSVLDQTCQEEVDQTRPQNVSVLPTSSSPKVPPEGEWVRSNSPDLELAALPLPPRRASKASTSHSGVDADDTNVAHSRSPFVPVVGNSVNTSPQTTLAAFPPRSAFLNFRRPRPTPAKTSTDLLSDVPNLTSRGSVVPSISISPPPHCRLTNAQTPNRKRSFIEDSDPKLDPVLRINTNIPPLQRKYSSQEYLSEARHTSSNPTIAQPMPSVRKSTLEDPPVRAEETNPNSPSYVTFTRSSESLSATTPSVVFRPGTANTFGGSEILGSNIRPGSSDSVQSGISTPTERVKSYSSLAGSSLRLTASPISFTSTETP